MTIQSIENRLEGLCLKARSFFEECRKTLSAVLAKGYWESTPEYYWRELTEELKDQAEDLTFELLDTVKPFAHLCKASVLATGADLKELSVAVRVMRAALHLREYRFYETEEIHDEGNILGIRPASQEEREPLRPHDAYGKFVKSANNLMRILQVCDTEHSQSSQGIDPGATGRYRPNTAFIMMWMNPAEAMLEDVRDAVQEVFGEFNIRAVRADDIEHEGRITDKVLDEIRTSEFLFADLTGTRPNVYYEVGFAHALGKRVILFRKRDTPLHFDLSGYNCPEYENLRDLKEKLRKRISSITNKALNS